MAMKEDRPKLLLQQFIDSLTHASGGAWQMIHAHQDPRFIPIRDAIDNLKNSAIAIALMPSDGT